MVPRSGTRNPSTHSSVVVLPAPFGPISPKISPSLTSNDTSSTATVLPYVLRQPETRMTGGAVTRLFLCHGPRAARDLRLLSLRTKRPCAFGGALIERRGDDDLGARVEREVVLRAHLRSVDRQRLELGGVRSGFGGDG